jgi:integrase
MERKRRGRREGGIRSREGKDLWEVTVRLPNGKRRTAYAKTKKEAQEKLRQMQNEGLAGIATDPEKRTVGQYLTAWLETTAKRSVRHGTWTRYEQLVRQRIAPHLGECRLDKVTPAYVEQFLTDLEKAGVKPRGQQMAVNVLGRVLKDAVRLKFIASNPVRDAIKPNLPKPEMKEYGPDEVGRFLAAAAADRLYALYVLAIDSGMREGELFALEWSDIDLQAGWALVQRALKGVKGKLTVEELKTAKSRRRLQVSRLTLDALHEHRKRQLAEGTSGKLVFCDTSGTYLRRPNVARRSFHPLLKTAGLPRIRFHDLRHTCATLLLLANEPTKVVSERLGHGMTQTTENSYQHVLPTMQERVAEKMDALLGQILSPKAEGEASAGWRA